jgi:hypothetical protein
MQGEYLFDLIQANSKMAMGAATMPDHRQAMPAIIVREHEEQNLTMLAQTGGEETTSSIFAQTESENRVLVSEACTQTEQMLLPENLASTVSQIKNENEISTEEYMQTILTIDLRLKMSELTAQDIEEMKEEALKHWDRADENWMNGKIPGVEMENQNEAFSSLLSTLQAEQMKIYSKTTENEEANVQVSYGLSDGQEQAIDSNADGRMSSDQATETPTEHSNESDYEQLPGLIDLDAEEDMGPEACKRDHIDSGVQPRAPGGPIKEKRVGNSSRLTQTTINYQNEQDTRFQKTMSRIGRSTKSRICVPLLCGGSNKIACVGRSKLKLLWICLSALGKVTCQTMRLMTSRITIIATDQWIGSQWTSGLVASVSTRQQCLGWQEYDGAHKKLAGDTDSESVSHEIPSQSLR